MEVAYALREKQMLIALEIGEGATVRDAIDSSGVLEYVTPGGAIEGRVGIFGRRVGLETVLGDGDRVEIYRPLIADPKEARRNRAQRAPRQARRR